MCEIVCVKKKNSAFSRFGAIFLFFNDKEDRRGVGAGGFLLLSLCGELRVAY